VPTPESVREQLTDILVRVVDCNADAVVPDANLKSDLNVDSLTVVEMGDELGRRFGIYLSDDAIDGFITVQDAVDAVTGDPEATKTAKVPLAAPAVEKVVAPLKPARIAPAATSPSRPPTAPRPSPEILEKRRGMAEKFAVKLGLVGAGIGVVLGFGGGALVSASGIGDVALPPLSIPTTTTTTATATPSPAPTTGPSASTKPTLNASSTQVSPGERFTLEGAFPALGAGATLQVQVRDSGAAWDDFPVATTTRDGGKYKTQIYTSRTGDREFRLLHKDSGKASPAVTVAIG